MCVEKHNGEKPRLAGLWVPVVRNKCHKTEDDQTYYNLGLSLIDATLFTLLAAGVVIAAASAAKMTLRAILAFE